MNESGFVLFLELRNIRKHHACAIQIPMNDRKEQHFYMHTWNIVPHAKVQNRNILKQLSIRSLG